MLYTKMTDDILEKLGVNTDEFSDNLYSTKLKALAEVPLGGGGSGGGVFYVDVTWDENSFNEGTGMYGDASANKTFDEVYVAYQQGLNVVARVHIQDGSSQIIDFYPLQYITHTTSASECHADFDHLILFPLGVQNLHIGIYGDGHTYVSQFTLMIGG